jgi:flagellar basal-body rod protein FlgG
MSTRALRTAASGMYAQQLNIEVISNNIANINTTGYKKNKAEFKDLMYQQVMVNPLSSATPGITESVDTKIQVGNGVQPASAQKIFKQGDITSTGGQLDLAIKGEGFFQVKKADGTLAYTRDGSFKVSADGTITTAAGYVIEPGLTLNEDVININISKDGAVEVQTAGSNTFSVIGNLQLAKFINPAGLVPLGDNLYAESLSSGKPMLANPAATGYGEVEQGFLEASNVDIVEEMVAMIQAQRAYEINSKTVKTVEDMMTMANNLKA